MALRAIWVIGIGVESRGARQCRRAAPQSRVAAAGRVMSKKKAKDSGSGTIALNKKARFEYKLEDRYEAGVELQGWEVKALRAGRISFNESYAIVRGGEIFLFGAQITPLNSASTHVLADDRRTRKLLLHKREINKLIGAVEREGYTLIPTALYWKNNRVKCEIALAEGKKEHDKRAATKERDWQRDKQRVMRRHNPSA
jgi:SsrA-binding protein